MSSASTNEKMHPNSNAKTDVLLADKTLEFLRLVEMADTIMKSSFNNDTAHWMDAILRVLILRNSAYLLEERDTYSESQSFCEKLHTKLFSMYSEMETAKRDTGDHMSENYSDFILTCSSLMKLFSKFTSLLVKNNGIVVDGKDFIDDAKTILKNMAKFISKHERDNVAKTSNANEVDNSNYNSSSVPSSSSTLSIDSIRPGDSVASRPVNSAVPKTSTDGEVETAKTKQRVFTNSTFSTSNKELQSIDGSTTSLIQARKSSISTTTSKPSRSLSEGDRSHSVDFLSKNVPAWSEIEAAREYLNSSLGDESNLFEIHGNTFHCTVCNCDIYALQNVVSHASGKQHMKSLNANKKGNVSDPQSVSQSITMENIQKETEKVQSAQSTSSDPEQVLQISNTAIPVEHLEL